MNITRIYRTYCEFQHTNCKAELGRLQGLKSKLLPDVRRAEVAGRGLFHLPSKNETFSNKILFERSKAISFS